MYSPKISPPITPRRNSSRSGISSNTNSLVVTGLPSSFFEPTILNALREHFSTYGPLYAWSPIRSFSRVFIVYYTEADAERAKIGSDGVSVDAVPGRPETVLRVYRADPVQVHMPSTCCEGKRISPHHLRPPHDKSASSTATTATPSSSSNTGPPAGELIAALRELQISRSATKRPASNGRSQYLHPHSHGPSPKVLVVPDQGAGVGIYVQDCDGRNVSGVDSDTEFKAPSPRRRNRMPIPAARPPMPTAV